MSLYLPRLPLQLDPLIAEAKRRARRRRFIVVAALALVAVGVGALGRWELSGANASAATASSGKQCARSSTYGSQCIDALGSGRRVTEIQTWFDDTSMFWPNDKWRIDLERYICDPIGKTKTTCSAASTWHGRVLTGARVVDRQSQPLHLAQSRSNGYWPTFPLPHTFRSNVWLCTEVAAYNAATHRWVYNAAGLAHGVRACISVHH
jgi:hypothetical protein